MQYYIPPLNYKKMNTLSQYTQLLNRFPKFELSYETISHKKVSASDSVVIAISLGRKYFIWFTYKCGGSNDACYLIGLDKDKQICSVEPLTCDKIPQSFCLGTVVYGTLYEPQQETTRKIFIAEDVYYHSGVNLSNLCFGDRVGFLRDFVEKTMITVSTVAFASPVAFALPMMWHLPAGNELSPIIPPNISSNIGYTPHHIQFREIRRVAPYINIAIPKRGAIQSSATVTPVSSATVAQKMTATAIMNPIPKFDFSKPAYRYPAIFNITADPQLDLYHLYAYGGPGVAIYCGLAAIQTFKTSIFMNKLFRRIRENDNLDLAEESEDEGDFENMDADKYVNLNAVIPVECVFNQKHKKWMPVRLAGKTERLIHIEKLVYNAFEPTAHRGGVGGEYGKRPFPNPKQHQPYLPHYQGNKNRGGKR